MIVLLNPLTYMAIAAAIAVAPEGPVAAAYRRIVVAVCLVFLMPPLAWIIGSGSPPENGIHPHCRHRRANRITEAG